MSDIDAFTLYPLQMDPSSKAISDPTAAPDSAISRDLEKLNILHRAVVSLDTTNNIPPPPVPPNPKRSLQVDKLRDAANEALRKGSYPDAVRLYSLAIDMALSRPPWELASLVRREVFVLYGNRSQAYMLQQLYAEGYVDALTSVKCAPTNAIKSWWRAAKCLLEMSRFEEAKEFLKDGLEMLEPELKSASSSGEKDKEKDLRRSLPELRSLLAEVEKRTPPTPVS